MDGDPDEARTHDPDSNALPAFPLGSPAGRPFSRQKETCFRRVSRDYTAASLGRHADLDPRLLAWQAGGIRHARIADRSTTRCELQEVDNAVNQAMKEIRQRYDFKGLDVNVDFKRAENKLVLRAPDEFKIRAMWDVVQEKMVRRHVPLKNLQHGNRKIARLKRFSFNSTDAKTLAFRRYTAFCVAASFRANLSARRSPACLTLLG